MRWSPLLVAIAACSAPESKDEARSEGMPVAQLTVRQQVAIFDAAVRTAFDVGPGLVLMLNPSHLPSGSGREGGPPVPDSMVSALRNARIVEGTCEPMRSGDQRAPICKTQSSGYVIQSSEIFQAGGDTVRMYLSSEIYAAEGGQGHEPFQFEMAYKLVPAGGGRWRVVAEGRVRTS